MLRNLNTTRNGKRICGLPTVGVLGSAVPTTGEGGRAALLANDVAFNNLYTNEVRLWITGHDFPGTFFVDEYSRWEVSGLTDGIYTATGVLIVDDEDADVEAVVLRLTVGGDTTVVVTGTLSETVVGAAAGTAVLGGIVQADGAVLDATDGLVSGTVTLSVPAIGEAITAFGSVLGQADGVLSAIGSLGDGSEPVPLLPAGRRSIVAGRTVAQTLSPLDIAEIDDLSIDFASELAAGDPIVTLVATAHARYGTDLQSRPVLYGDWQIDGHKARQRITGVKAVAGVTYLLRFEATAASGQSAVAAAFIKVVRKS